MSEKVKRAVLYVRVSTDGQTTENQKQALEALAAQRGWRVTETYEDCGVSGAKSRDKRPGLDRMLKDATRGRFDVVLSWAVDRLGRSLQDLLGVLDCLKSANVDLVLHQQALDTTTPAGRAMFQMCGIFAEFERSMIVSRVHAGLQRARKQGKTLGRPKVAPGIEQAVRARLAEGAGILKVAGEFGIGSGTVQRIKAEMQN